MPYKVVKRGGARPWKIIRADNGKQVGSSKTRAEAVKSMRARYAAENRK